MSEYRLFKVIRTEGQKYFDIEYVRDVVTCGECRKANTMECINRAYNEPIDKWEIWYMGDNWFCADGEVRDE